ncbi:response regulator [Cohnella sp. GCM10027633]|uniref:hybrid sensor histidine kinase/response regulator n=1 Tax=unclassified Cohnella TaxID=2636738 RepID=UPI00362B8B47
MHHIHGSYDTLLIVFSYVVAVVASYTVLDLVERIIATDGWRKWTWLTFGAVAMGMGIWSMHFVGMLAFTLPVTVKYELGTVLLSIVAAVAGSFAALWIVSAGALNARRLIGGGVMLAVGICAMHYIGMAAMVIDITYDPLYFTLSVVIAFVASVSALWLSLYFRRGGKTGAGWMKIGSGLIMGGAIVGMHYTGMAAANFHVGAKVLTDSGVELDQRWLAYLISGGTLYTLGLSILGMFISKKFSNKDSEILSKTNEIHKMNLELRLMNDRLEDLVAERTAQFEQARDEAVRANMIKSQFLANMSHELRTPLNAIIGYSEMLGEEAAELGEPMFVDDLGKISKSGKHLLALINDILDISKIEAGKMEVYVETFEIADLVRDVVETVKPLMAAGGNRFEYEVSRGEISTDMTKLRQILFNLLSNASKFTKDGSVVLEVAGENRNRQDGYRFTIRDTGIGMSAEQADKLFQPFMQADASTTRKFGGTGLGLAITRSFCLMLGGDIEVRSEPGAGSTFTCWLPAGTEGQEESSSAVGMPSTEPSQVSVLLIDDEPLNGQLMKRYLDKEGWTLAFASSGQEGLRLAKELRPKVICLDILMPGMDGWSVLQAIKSDPELQDTPVVIWSMTGDKSMGYALGASEFLMKPIDRNRLLGMMDKYVTSRSDQAVLVIEDDSATSELMARLLQKEGYAVLRAGNGLEALACMEKRTPRLILLDLMMPEMDGFQFVAELRKREIWDDIPIVVVSAKTVTPEDRIKLNGYVKGILRKGEFDHRALLQEIRKFVNVEGGRPG